MKFYTYSVYVLLYLVSVPLVHGDDSSANDAMQFLVQNKPAPDISLGWVHTDPHDVEIDRQLIAEQMKSITSLIGAKNTTAISVLIPFLGYNMAYQSSYSSLGNARPGAKLPDKEEVSRNWPAFAAIVSIPGAADFLRKYALDKKNFLDYRIASFHVLRYIDSDQFKIVKDNFDVEFANANSDIRHFLGAVEDGTLGFEGIFPLSYCHDHPPTDH